MTTVSSAVCSFQSRDVEDDCTCSYQCRERRLGVRQTIQSHTPKSLFYTHSISQQKFVCFILRTTPNAQKAVRPPLARCARANGCRLRPYGLCSQGSELFLSSLPNTKSDLLSDFLILKYRFFFSTIQTAVCQLNCRDVSLLPFSNRYSVILVSPVVSKRHDSLELQLLQGLGRIFVLLVDRVGRAEINFAYGGVKRKCVKACLHTLRINSRQLQLGE